MLTIAICEDEANILEDLKRKLNEYTNKQKVDVKICGFSGGISLLASDQRFDVILMDIKMSGMDGMEVVRQIRAKGGSSQVIFVTSSKAYVFQAFDVDAVHYLVKPVSDQDLFHALDKAIKRCGQVDTQTLTIAKGTSVQVLPFRDILYCEAINHKIYIYTTTGEVDCYMKLDALAEQLDARFFRCHRSYLVNMNFVTGKEGDTAIMANGHRLPVSRRKQQQFLEQLLSFIRSEVL